MARVLLEAGLTLVEVHGPNRNGDANGHTANCTCRDENKFTMNTHRTHKYVYKHAYMHASKQTGASIKAGETDRETIRDAKQKMR